MLRGLYDRTIRLAEGCRSTWAPGAVSLKLPVFPIPPGAPMILKVAARPRRGCEIAAVATAFAGALGGFVGFAAIGPS